MIKDLLLNLFLITYMPLLLVSIWGEKFALLKNRMQKIVINIIGSIAAILCMTFPVHLANGFIFDLRNIPIIIILLFLGYKDSIPLIVTTLVYRFLIGGEGSYIYAIVHLTTFLIVPQFHTVYRTINLPKKVLLAGLITGFFSILALSIPLLFASSPLEYGNFVYYFFTIEVVGIMITAILIEYILKNIKQKDHYVKTEKLRVVGELAAGVSHEINNPLTVTYGFLQLLGEESLTPAERKKYITLALEELNRTHEIMENYLILANPYQDQIEKVNLKEEIQLIGEKLQGYAILQGVSITINCPQNLYLECERKKLQQVILNIAKNAIEAMDSGGILFIEFIQKKHHIIMNFQDNGIGMSPEQISKLGEPYFSSNTKGTGIGLMVAYRIIQSLGGTISCQPNKRRNRHKSDLTSKQQIAFLYVAFYLFRLF